MLEIEKGKFLERSSAILRYLVRQNKEQSLYNENDHLCNDIDQILDFCLNNLTTDLMVLNAAERGIIEFGKKDLKELQKTLQNNLRKLDTLCAFNE